MRSATKWTLPLKINILPSHLTLQSLTPLPVFLPPLLYGSPAIVQYSRSSQVKSPAKVIRCRYVEEVPLRADWMVTASSDAMRPSLLRSRGGLVSSVL